MEILSFTGKRFQISLSYIKELLSEKNFVQNEDTTSFTKEGITIFVNKMSNNSVNNNLILMFIVANELGQVLFSNNAIIKSDSSLDNNFSNIDIAVKALENHFDFTKSSI